jgi:cytochrome c-type biogenesis protein CcmH/NrfG
MFVLLALVFGLGFVVFGVGSGSSGISDALQSAFHFGSSGTSISGLEKKTAKDPTDAKAWRDLATAYETKQRTPDAIGALERFLELKPRNADALSELAAQQQLYANTVYNDLVAADTRATTLAPQSLFTPSGTSGLAPLFTSTNALEDPVATAITAAAQTDVDNARQKLIDLESQTETTYKRLVALAPKDANNQLSLAHAAQTNQDTAVAVAAYKAFLKLVPASDPQVADAKAQLKALTAPSSDSGSSG